MYLFSFQFSQTKDKAFQLLLSLKSDFKNCISTVNLCMLLSFFLHIQKMYYFKWWDTIKMVPQEETKANYHK